LDDIGGPSKVRTSSPLTRSTTPSWPFSSATGAMAGAAWGLSGVPAALLDRLEARDELEALADALGSR
jgi:hypothetical protein